MAQNTVGYLLVSVRTADGVLLIPGALVRVYDSEGMLLYDGVTNQDGYTEEIEVITPPKENSLAFGRDNPYTTVSIFVEKEGFYDARYLNVQIFPYVVTIQQTNLQPSIAATELRATVMGYGDDYE